MSIDRRHAVAAAKWAVGTAAGLVVMAVLRTVGEYRLADAAVLVAAGAWCGLMSQLVVWRVDRRDQQKKEDA
jgi:hypothetical protein